MQLLLRSVTAFAMSIAAMVAAAGGDASCAEAGRDITNGPALLQMHSQRGLVKGAPLEVPVAQAAQHSAGPRGRIRGSALQKSEQTLDSFASRSRMYVAHQGFLRRALEAAEAGRNASNQELDTLITNFIAAHTASEDHCPAELLEAKHQLNALHQEILNTLAQKVNSTEDKILKDDSKINDVVKDIKDLDKTKDEADKKLAEKNAEQCKMLETLKKEIGELRAIAQPQVTMNITERALGTAGGALSLTDAKLALFQEASAPAIEASQSAPPPVRGATTQDLLRKTHDAASEVLHCEEERSRLRVSLTQLSVEQAAPQRKAVERLPTAEQNGSGNSSAPAANCSENMSAPVTVGNLTAMVTSPGGITNGLYRAGECSSIDTRYGGAVWFHCSSGNLTADGRGCVMLADEVNCTLQKNSLEKAYVKAYVELARLIDEYEELCSSTDEQDALDEEHKNKKGPLEDEADKLKDQVADNTKELQKLKPKLDDASIAEAKLRAHVRALSRQCSALNKTESSLDEVRAAIHALDACPGFVRPEFHIPAWVGNWTTFDLDNTKSDAANDAMMLATCRSTFGTGTRPAEVGEIEATSIEGMPQNNTAEFALVGACQRCEGKADADTGNTNLEGHSRVCWFPDKPLSAAHRGDCSLHQKAIMCVTDRGDIRKVVWASNYSVSNYTPGNYTA